MTDQRILTAEPKEFLTSGAKKESIEISRRRGFVAFLMAMLARRGSESA